LIFSAKKATSYVIIGLRVGKGGRQVEKEVETSSSLSLMRSIYTGDIAILSLTFNREEEQDVEMHQEDSREKNQWTQISTGGRGKQGSPSISVSSTDLASKL
jgi:hypothetical protein